MTGVTIMQLAGIYDNIDPVRILLTGYLPDHNIAYINSAIRYSQYGPVRNELISENLIGNLSKAAILKSKAAVMIPKDVRTNPRIAKLIDLAKKIDAPVASDEMSKWWNAVGKEIANLYDGVNKADLISATLPIVKAAEDKLDAELQDRQAETNKSRSKKDELAAKKREQKQSGTSNQTDEKRQRRAKTIAKLLGLENTDDIDPDTLDKLLNMGSPSGGRNGMGLLDKIRMFLKHIGSIKNLKSVKGLKKLKKEDAELVLNGLAKMVIVEAPRPGTLGKLGRGLSLPFKYAGAAMKAPLDAASAAYDDWESGAEGHKKVGAGLISLFSREGRDQLGANAVTNAAKSYLISLAISTMIHRAEAIVAQNDPALDDEDAMPVQADRSKSITSKGSNRVRSV